MPTTESVHVSIRIERPARDVYAYVSAPEKMVEWAAGLSKGLRRDGDAWIGEAPTGAVRVRFVSRNELGVVDHDVTLPDGTVVHVPLRVLANGTGAEVVLTVLRMPGMTDRGFEDDVRAVRHDLETLKRVLEK